MHFIHSNLILPEDPQTESTEIKKEICRNVFTSSYFKINREEDWFDTDVLENRVELKKRDVNLYYSIYTIVMRDEGESSSSLLKKRKFEEVYENKSTHRTGFIDSLEEEDLSVFKCLVKKQSSAREISVYFVSEVYKMSLIGDNGFSNLHFSNVVGRFIFTEIKEEEKLKLVVYAADSTKLKREFNVITQADLENLKSFL